MSTVRCTRCHAEREALAAPPFRAGTRWAPLGLEIAARICAPCYREWLEHSVRMVNEHRIDTAEPAGQAAWLAQMRAFLGLDAARDPWARFLGRRVRIEPLGAAGGGSFTARLLELDGDALWLTELDAGAPTAALAPGRAPGSVAIARDAVITLEGDEEQHHR
jgi:Fe-S cluster biosynthesis and repair protein YggX